MGGGGPSQDITTTNQKQNTRSLSVGDTSSTGSTTGGTTGTSFGGTTGQTTAEIPDWLRQFVGDATGTAGTALSTAGDIAGGYQLPPEALQALTQTAGGQFLYGGPQQQAFIDAAVRGASPGIFSQFGAVGGGGGGLQRAALDQSAVDAYAKLYQGERANQLTAAQALPGITQMPFNMQTQLAGLAAGLPGQFAPFLGQSQTGTSFGNTAGTMFGTTQDTGTSRTQSKTSGTGTTQEIKPLYETPWWQTALGAAATGASLLAAPMTGGASLAATPGLMSGLLGGVR